MKETESYEQLLARFTKRQTQLEMRQVELEEAHLEYVKPVSYTHLTLPTILLV